MDQINEELRGKIFDFSIYSNLVNLSTKRSVNAKESEVERMYLALQKWIFDNIALKVEEEKPDLDF